MKLVSSYLDSHFNESFSIREAGMKLIPEQYSKIRSRLQLLENRAPAISSINLEFINEGQKTIGLLSILGAGKKFISKQSGKDPWELYKKLEKEIDAQLFAWKKNRFRNKKVNLSKRGEKQVLAGGYAL